MFIPEIMMSIGLHICIMSANWHKLRQFTSCQFTYGRTWSEEHVSLKKLFNKSYLHVANFNLRNFLFCACTVINKKKYESALFKTVILIILQLRTEFHAEK